MAEATGETAHLSHLVAGRLTTLAFAYARAHGTKVMMDDTDTLPFHATASGLSVLAFLPDAERDGILAAPLPRLAPQTPTDPAEVQVRLASVRAAGLAEVVSAFELDVHGIAAPLFGPAGEVIGATAVATPAPRMTEDLQARIRREVARGAAEITLAWGGRAPEAVLDLWAEAA
jgi:DNA-binding IclR family transcriptional regulator